MRPMIEGICMYGQWAERGTILSFYHSGELTWDHGKPAETRGSILISPKFEIDFGEMYVPVNTFVITQQRKAKSLRSIYSNIFKYKSVMEPFDKSIRSPLFITLCPLFCGIPFADNVKPNLYHKILETET